MSYQILPTIARPTGSTSPAFATLSATSSSSQYIMMTSSDISSCGHGIQTISTGSTCAVPAGFRIQITRCRSLNTLFLVGAGSPVSA